MHPLETHIIKYAQGELVLPDTDMVPESLEAEQASTGTPSLGSLGIAIPAGMMGTMMAAGRLVPRAISAGAALGSAGYYGYLQLLKTAPRLLYTLLQLDLASSPGRSEMERLALALTYAHGAKELNELQKDLLARYIVKLKEQEEKMKKRKEKEKEREK